MYFTAMYVAIFGFVAFNKIELNLKKGE